MLDLKTSVVLEEDALYGQLTIGRFGYALKPQIADQLWPGSTTGQRFSVKR